MLPSMRDQFRIDEKVHSHLGLNLLSFLLNRRHSTDCLEW
jgi:hypothetical protein